MGKRFLCLLMMQTLIWKIPSTNGQRSIQQYLHLTGLPYTTVQVPATNQNAVTSNQVTTTNHAPTGTPLTNQQLPTTGLASLSALSLPSLLAGLSQPIPEKPKADIQKPLTSNIDSKLLNNLAVALQLLILSNILNGPPADSTEKLKEKNPEPPKNLQHAPQNQYISPQNQIMPPQNQYAPPQNVFFPPQNELVPGANFIGGSNFAEPNLMQTLNPVRSSMTLKSPYEALGTLTAFSDPTSQFSALDPRKDFLSPYAMMDKDVISVNELF